MFIHEIFEAWVSKVPNNIAILFEGQTLTYQGLNNRANQLARYLKTQGVGPESVVGICLERCPDLVVALFGVLKAGGACLPLDPSYPPERLAYMLKDTHADFMVTRDVYSATMVAVEKADALGADLKSFTGSTKIRSVLLDSEWPAIDNGGTEDPHYTVLPNNLAFIFYTSGSTGNPKAVMWEHGEREVHASWEEKTFRLTEQDRHLLKAPIGFTLLAAEVFLPLLSGGRLIIVPTGLEQDVNCLTKLIAQHRITRITLVPSMLRALVEQDDFPNCTSLREVCTFGEALTEALQKRFYQHSEAALTLVYGATEAPSATYFKCDRNRSLFPMRLGTPLPGKEIYLLSDQLERVGLGEQGEICVGGRLARGYMGRPDLTAEKFFPHPFAKEPGARLYRTGDFGRYLPDGAIEFIGRVDYQLKIRGFRIEPGEVERAICEHPAISQALVTVREDKFGESRLVAYLTARVSCAPSNGALRRYLKDKLPNHMIPGLFVTLAAMPLTPNGKPDRRALPDPDGLRPELDVPYIAPRSPVETELAKIWAEVLGIDRVGIHDNFFDLGGDSLLAIKFISLLRERAGVDLPVRMIFESPTPATLAERLAIENQTTGSGEATAVGTGRFIIQQTNPIAAGKGLSPIAEILGKQRDYVRTWKGKRSTPESFIVTLNDSGKRQGLFWCLQGYRELTQLANHLGRDQPVHGMRSGHLAMEYTDENVDAIASHYAAELIALQPDGSFLLGGNCQGGKIARVIALRLRDLGRRVSLLILMEQGSFPPYDDSVALIFGRDSHFNPYKQDADPEAVFRSAYPVGFTVDIIAGAHGKFFESPNIETLASAVKRRLAALSEARHLPAPLVL